LKGLFISTTTAMKQLKISFASPILTNKQMHISYNNVKYDQGTSKCMYPITT
jgi:hypothetical protein